MKKVGESDDGAFQNNGDVSKIFACGYSNVILTNDNKPYSFGSGMMGQLGLGSTASQKTPTRGGYYYSLNGKALTHTKESTTKYSTDVLVDYVTEGSTVNLKKGQGTYQEITLDAEGRYLVGTQGNFVVNVNEEVEFTIKVVKDTNVFEYTFVIDKKPPVLKDLSVNCSFEENIYYCNQNTSVDFIKDISHFYQVIKKQGVSESNLTLPDVNAESAVVDNLEFTSDEEAALIEYTVIDGAGNQTIIKIIMDNYIPRVEIK